MNQSLSVWSGVRWASAVVLMALLMTSCSLIGLEPAPSPAPKPVAVPGPPPVPPPPSEEVIERQAELRRQSQIRSVLGTQGQIEEKDLTEPAPSEEPVAETAPPDPQQLAAMDRVDQATACLDRNDTQCAIGLLEQAIQLDGYNGEAYYHLARAWRMEGRSPQALEFAKKAEMLLDAPDQLRPVYQLEATLLDDLGRPAEAEEYRAKAQRLSGHR